MCSRVFTVESNGYNTSVQIEYHTTLVSFMLISIPFPKIDFSDLAKQSLKPSGRNWQKRLEVLGCPRNCCIFSMAGKRSLEIFMVSEIYWLTHGYCQVAARCASDHLSMTCYDTPIWTRCRQVPTSRVTSARWLGDADLDTDLYWRARFPSCEKPLRMTVVKSCELMQDLESSASSCKNWLPNAGLLSSAEKIGRVEESGAQWNTRALAPAD